MGATAGVYTGNQQWTDQVNQQFKRFKDTHTERMLSLQHNGAQLEKTGKEDLQQLNGRIEKVTNAHTSPSHVQAVESERRYGNAVMR